MVRRRVRLFHDKHRRIHDRTGDNCGLGVRRARQNKSGSQDCDQTLVTGLVGFGANPAMHLLGHRRG